MWQLRIDTLHDDHLNEFNATLELTVEGMGSPLVEDDHGTFAINKTFFAL